MAVDLLDLRYGEAACMRSPAVRVSDDWAVFSPLRMCSPSRLVREITTFVRGDDDCWRRDDEQHVNVLMDTALSPGSLIHLESISPSDRRLAPSRRQKDSSPSSGRGTRSHRRPVAWPPRLRIL